MIGQGEKRPLCKCGKVPFDKKGAQTMRNKLLRRGNERYMRIYQCPDSGWWHITKAAMHDGELRRKHRRRD